MPRPSARLRSKRSPGRTLGLFLLLNIILLGAAAVLFVMWQRGEIVFNDPPAGFGLNLGIAGGALVLLVLCASLSLPVAHRAVKDCRRGHHRVGAILGGREEGSKFLALLIWPGYALGMVLAWPVRAILILLSFALIGVVGVFLVRCANPEFLEEPIKRAIAWGTEFGQGAR